MDDLLLPHLSKEYLAARDQMPVVSDSGPLGRLAYGAAMLGPRVAAGFGDIALHLTGDSGHVMTEDHPAGVDGFSQAVDVVGQIAPIAVGMGAIGKSVSAIPAYARLAETAPRAANAIKLATEFGAVGEMHDNVTGLEQAAEGGAIGAIAELPLRYRIPLALALGAGSKAFFDRDLPADHTGITQGDISGGLGAALGILGKLPRPVRRPIANHFDPVTPEQPFTAPPLTPEGVFANVARPEVGRSAAESAESMQAAWQAEKTAADEAIRTRMGYDPAATGNPALLSEIQRQPMPVRTGETQLHPSLQISAADSADAIIENLLPKKAPAFQDPAAYREPRPASLSAYFIDPNIEATAASKGRVAPMPSARVPETGFYDPTGIAINPESTIPPATPNVAKGKLQSIPEWQRTQGGYVAPHMLAGGLGATMGALADPENPLQGAAIGLGLGVAGAHYVPGLFAKVAKEAEGLRPLTREKGAIDIGGTVGESERVAKLREPEFMSTKDELGVSKPEIWWRGSNHHELPKTGEIWLTTNPEYARGFGSNVKPYRVEKPRSIGSWNASHETPQENWTRLESEGHDAAFHHRDDGTLIVKPDHKLVEMQVVSQHGEPLRFEPKLQPLQKGKGSAGSTDLAIPAVITRATIGGLLGGAAGGQMDDPGSHDNMGKGAIGGALAAVFGPSMLKLAHETNVRPSIANSEFSISNLISRAKLKVLTNEASVADRVVARLDSALGLSHTESLKRMLDQAKGAPALHLNELDEAFRNLGKSPVTEELKAATMSFLEGKSTLEEYGKILTQDKVEVAEAYKNFATVARSSIDGLIEVASKGLGNTQRAQMMLDSREAYMRQSYKLFTTEFKPSPDSVDRLAAKIANTGEWQGMSVEDTRDALWQFAEDVQRQKTLYKPKTGKGIDQTVFMQRKLLDQEWKDFLGEITDPVQRVNLTVLKLRPIAEASHFMSRIVTEGGVKSPEGLALSYADRAAKEAALAEVNKVLANNPTDKMALRAKDELAQYKYIDQDVRNGALRGKLVHRSVADVLREWDQNTKTDSAFTRTISSINGMMKANVTYRNPLATIKQVITAPIFAMIARARPEHLAEAWNTIREGKGEVWNEMISNGVLNADGITKDVLRDLHGSTNGLSSVSTVDGTKALLGRIDGIVGRVADKARNLDMKAASIFRTPDNIVRGGAYLSAKARIAERLGKELNDPEVINAALEYTNRYTMNYQHLSPAVAKGRSTPFVNLFISYTSEITRLMKNLGEDLIKGDALGGEGARLNAALALGTVSSLPSVMQAVSENNLSDKDKKEWEQVKSNLPDYSRHRFYWVKGRDATTGKFNYIDFTSLIPTDSLNQTVRALASGDVAALKQVNPVAGWDNVPILNVGAQLMAGRDKRTFREIRGTGDQVAIVAKELIGPWAPQVGSVAHNYNLAYGDNAAGGKGIVDAKGRTMTASDFWLPFWSGLRAGSYDLSQQNQFQVSQAKRQIAEEVAYMKDVANSTASADQQAKAITRGQEAIRVIQESLASRLRIPADRK